MMLHCQVGSVNLSPGTDLMTRLQAVSPPNVLKRPLSDVDETDDVLLTELAATLAGLVEANNEGDARESPATAVTSGAAGQESADQHVSRVKRRKYKDPTIICDENAPEGKRYRCPVAGCTYASGCRRYVLEHKKTHNKSAKDKTYKCPVPGCNYAAARPRYVGEHMRTHTGEKRHKCPHPGCNYAASGRGHLNRHMRIHTGEKPHKCTFPGCNYASTQTTHLTEHMRIHSGEKPFKCPVPGCRFAFARSWHVSRHISQKHGGSKAAVAAGALDSKPAKDMYSLSKDAVSVRPAAVVDPSTTTIPLPPLRTMVPSVASAVPVQLCVPIASNGTDRL